MLKRVLNSSIMGSESWHLNTGLNFSELILPSVKNEYCVYKPFKNLWVIQLLYSYMAQNLMSNSRLKKKKKKKNTFYTEDMASERRKKKIALYTLFKAKHTIRWGIKVGNVTMST